MTPVIFGVFSGKSSERVLMTPVIFGVFSGRSSERVFNDVSNI